MGAAADAASAVANAAGSGCGGGAVVGVVPGAGGIVLAECGLPGGGVAVAGGEYGGECGGQWMRRGAGIVVSVGCGL